MGHLNIISADERLKQQTGSKLLICGFAGAGKTSLLRTVDPSTVLFQDVAVDQLCPQTWPELRDLACYLAGPDRNAAPTDPYSTAHYEAVCERYGGAEALNKYTTYFVDSLTVATRICFKWAQQQAEAHNAKGEKDTRGAYGLLGREVVTWATHLQKARSKNVIFVCLLDEMKDDFGRVSFALQTEGQKIARELPGIVDEVLTLAIMRPDDGPSYRAFITQADNEWGYPAKDRSGRLDALERPHLGQLLAKLNGKTAQISTPATALPTAHASVIEERVA
jgi:hypothetical protein